MLTVRTCLPAAEEEEWPLVAEMQGILKADGIYGTPGTTACFKAWGGEARCLLRVLRGNKHIVDDAVIQLYGILEFRTKYPPLRLETPGPFD
eukprot:COSAG05_NODE_1867_length_3930_cov_3.096842_6_plen_92_part_00